MVSKEIYISTGSMQAGGTERVISILARKFSASGYRIKIFIWRSLPVFYSLPEEVEVIDIPALSGSKSLIKNIVWFRQYLKNYRPDMVLSFSAPFNMVSIVSSLGLGIKTIVCERNDPRFIPFSRIQRLVRNVLYRFADGILTQTNYNKDYFSRCLQRKINVIHNPIFLSAEYVGSANYNNKEHIIVSVARLKEQKNQKMLINAFSNFVKSHPQYKLYIYGEGDLRTELERHITDLALTNKVFLPGVSKQIFKEMSKGEIFVLSSNFEGMPNTLIEAMCIGLPCVSTKVSGATDLIQNGVNGFLVNINDVAQMSEIFSKLAEDSSLRRMLGSSATKIYDDLNVDVIANEWLKYLNMFQNDKQKKGS